MHRLHIIAHNVLQPQRILGDGRPCPAVVALVSPLPAFILSAQMSIASYVTLPRASGNL